MKSLLYLVGPSLFIIILVGTLSSLAFAGCFSKTTEHYINKVGPIKAVSQIQADTTFSQTEKMDLTVCFLADSVAYQKSALESRYAGDYELAELFAEEALISLRCAEILLGR
jgi:hypothetical protein